MQGEVQSFLVRLWHEAVDSNGNVSAWRGSIDHVGADKRRHFQDLATILEFIQQETGITSETTQSAVAVCDDGILISRRPR